MAVLPAKKIKCSGSVDSKFQRTYRGIFQVIADLEEGPWAVENAVGIPPFGTSYVWGPDSDPWAFCNGCSADPREEINHDPGDSGGERKMRVWYVTVTWGTSPAERNGGTPRANPLDEPPVISGSFAGGMITAYNDKDKAPLVNAAGEPYNPGVPVMSNIDSLQISYNTATINLIQRANMIGRVNSVEMWGLDVRQVLLMRWDWNLLWAGELQYVAHNFEFHISREEHPTTSCTGLNNKVGWYTTLPNKGFAYLTVPGDKETKITKRDKEDMPLNTPIDLACDGTQAATESWNVFAVELEANFLLIPGMPNPLPGPFVTS